MLSWEIRIVYSFVLLFFSISTSGQEVEKLVQAAFHSDDKHTVVPDQLLPLAAYYHLDLEKIGNFKDFLILLRKKSIEYRAVNSDSSNYYAGQIVVTSKILHFPEGIHLGSQLLGKNYWLIGDLVKADSFADEAIKIARSSLTPDKEAATLDLKGSIARERGDFNLALQCHRRAAGLSAQVKDTISEALAISNEAVALDCQGHYKAAIEAYFKSLRILETTRDTEFIANTLLNIGALYSDNGYPNDAIEYYQKALALHRASNNVVGIVKCLMNLGESYNIKEQFQQAWDHLREAESMASKSGDPYDLANVYIGMQSVCAKQGLDTAGAQYLQKALNLFESLGAKPEMAEISLRQAEVLLKVGRFKEGAKAAQSTLMLSDSIQSVKIKLNALQALAEAYEKMGAPDLALSYYKQAVTLQDSLKGIEVQEKIHQLEIAYDTEKKEQLINKQKAAIQAQQLWTGIIALLLLIAVMFGIWLYRSNLYKKEINAVLTQQNNYLLTLNRDLETQLAELPTVQSSSDQVENLTITLSGQDKTVLRLADIVYIKADGNTVDIFTTNGKKYPDWQRLKSYVDLLEPSGLFIQTHRSYLINYRHIRNRRASELTMSSGGKVRIGNTLKGAVDLWLDSKLGGRASDMM